MIIQPKNRNCLSKQEIFDYLDQPGKLSRDEMHDIEAHMIDCALCASAIDGYQLLKETNYYSFKERLRNTDIIDMEEAEDSETEYKAFEKTQQEGPKHYRQLKDVKKVRLVARIEGERESDPVAAESRLPYYSEDKPESKDKKFSEAEEKKEHGGSKISFRMVAGILVIVLACFAVFSTYLRSDLNTLQAFGTGDELMLVVRGEPGSSETSGPPEGRELGLAIQYFEKGDYQLSAEHFEKVLQRGQTTNYSLLFFTGLSYLNAGDVEKAQGYLEQSITKDHLYIDEAHWHLARLYFEKGDKTRAKETLQFLRQSEDKNLKSKAIKLMRRI